MAYKLVWLADVLREAGLTVVEHEGWETRGRGDVGTIDAVIAHHTGKGSDKGLLNLIMNGRPDLAGPLSQVFLPRDGVWHLLAAGRCNHAGNGSWHGATGNSDTIGIEAANAGDGVDPWPRAQMSSYVRGVAAILRHLGKDELGVAGHKEFALPRGRKIDPTFDMHDFRRDVAELLADPTAQLVIPPAPVNPKRDMLFKGSRGASVKELQKLLGFKISAIDGDFGAITDAAVRAFQSANGLTADGHVGPKTWAALSKGN